MTGLKDQCFGVEVEMTGITRKQAAQALADYFGTIPKAKGGVYDTWKVKDPTGKEWKLVSDASIIGEQWTGTEYLENDIKDFRVELVTPKLTYPELPKLQECMRRLKQIGAKVNDSCGIHVHVDAANHNRQSLKNLISIMYSKEDLLFKALQVNEVRAIRFCKKVREPMLRKARALSAEETPDLTQLERIWYEGDVHKTDHYNWTRYPHLYGKEPVTVHGHDGQEHTVMAYVMTELCKEPSIPSFDYYNGILEGYRQNGLPTQPLKQAWEHCVEEVPRETERINRSACGQLSPRRKKDRGR